MPESESPVCSFSSYGGRSLIRMDHWALGDGLEISGEGRGLDFAIDPVVCYDVRRDLLLLSALFYVIVLHSKAGCI